MKAWNYQIISLTNTNPNNEDIGFRTTVEGTLEAEDYASAHQKVADLHGEISGEIVQLSIERCDHEVKDETEAEGTEI